MDRSRIKPIESQAHEKGGTADVEAAILVPAESSDCPEYDNVECVAIKKLRFKAKKDDGRVLAPFAYEVKLLNDLSHENIVKMIGFVEDVEKGIAWMVFSWEKNGNLREFVRSTSWELPERVSLIDDVAEGLSYLHSRTPPICHGDMKSLNILVNSEYRAVITDFGSARPVETMAEPTVGSDNASETPEPQQPPPTPASVIEALNPKVDPSGEFITMTGPAWTVRWAAPELLAGGSPGLASDIWALGWICWEAVTGDFPFNSLDDRIAVVVRIVKGDLPAIRSNEQLKQIATLCSLMAACWKLNGSERPTAARCRQVVALMDQTLPLRREGHCSDTPRSSGLSHALGWIRMRNGLIPDACELFQQSFDIANSVGYEPGKARALKALGNAFYLRSEYSKSEEFYIQARDTYSNIGDRLNFAQSVQGLGDIYRMRSENSKAEESLIEARNIFSEIEDQLGVAQSLRVLGELYCSQSEYSKAEESYIRARDIFSQLGDQLGLAQSIKGLGEIYRMRDEYSEAEESYVQARDIFSEVGDQLGFAQSVHSLGDVYGMQGEYLKAEQSYLQASNIYPQIDDQLGFAQSVQSLGDLYRAQSRYSKAEESLIQAHTGFSVIGDQLGFAQSVKSLGDVYRMQSQYSKAEELYVEARNIYSESGHKVGLAQSVKSLGDAYRLQGEYSKAEESFIQARDTFSEINDQLGMAQSVQSLGNVYRMRDEYSEAEKSYVQAREIFSQIGDQLGFANSIQGLARVLSARGEYGTAEDSYLEAQRVFHRIGDIHSSANVSWYLGCMHYKQARYEEAEKLMWETAGVYADLGLEQDLEDCMDALDQIRLSKEN